MPPTLARRVHPMSHGGHVLPAGAHVSILLRYKMGFFLKSTPQFAGSLA